MDEATKATTTESRAETGEKRSPSGSGGRTSAERAGRYEEFRVPVPEGRQRASPA